MLLPAADYNVYRGGTRLPAGDGARPPIGASPGELRLWMKLHGELDKDKLETVEKELKPKQQKLDKINSVLNPASASSSGAGPSGSN